MTLLRTLACLPLLAFAVGCGAEDQPRAAAAPAAKSTPDKAADKRIAEGAALRLEDMPSGWVEAEAGPDGDSPCKPVQAAGKLATAQHNSPRFNPGDGPTTLNSVHIFPDDATAQKGLELITSEETQACHAELVVGGLRSAEGVEVGEPTMREMSVEPLGDQRQGTRVTVPISGQAIELDMTIDLVFVRVGRGVTTNVFIDARGPFEPKLRDKLNATIVQRLTDGL